MTDLEAAWAAVHEDGKRARWLSTPADADGQPWGMAGEQVESLVREYRGWKWVIDDLFADDAAFLAEDGWHVASTKWRRSSENTRFIWRLINWLPVMPWQRPERTEFLLLVTYERHSP